MGDGIDPSRPPSQSESMNVGRDRPSSKPMPSDEVDPNWLRPTALPPATVALARNERQRRERVAM